MAKQREQWTMPAWMEPYRGRINNTGGNTIEELMNDHESTVQNNVVRAMLCVAVKSQVSLLERLHADALLAAESEGKGC